MTTRTRPPWKSSLLLALSALAVALAIWIVIHLSSGQVDTVAIVGLLVTVVALVLQIVSFLREVDESWGRSPGERADELANILRQEWHGEVEARRIRSPRILPLSWTESHRRLADNAEAVVVGSATNVIVSLRLDGRLDSNFGDAPSKLAEGFDRIPSKRLVIIGEPGAGKSVLALLLGVGLLHTRGDGEAVPAILPLSSWDPLREDLDSWMLQQLAVAYFNGDTRVPTALLRSELILPILDGLDEVPEPLRRTATRRINQAVNYDRPIVVTCRSTEYAELIDGGAPRLSRAPVVEVSAVPSSDAIAYLRGVDWPSGVCWDAVFVDLVRSPRGLVGLTLSTPLMIGFARTVYQRLGGNPSELLDERRFGSRHAIEEYLTDQMIDAAYAPPLGGGDATDETTPASADARRWLAFLAQYLQRHRERELTWWLLSGRVLPWWIGPALGIGGATLLMTVVASSTIAFLGQLSNISGVLLMEGAFCIMIAVLTIVLWTAGGQMPGRLALTRRGSIARLRRGFRSGFLAATAILGTATGTAAAIITFTASWTLEAARAFAAGSVTAFFLALVVGLATAMDAWLRSSPSAGAERASPLLTLSQDRRLAVVGSVVAGCIAGVLTLPALTAGLLLGPLLVQASTGWSGWPGDFSPAGLFAVVASAIRYVWQSPVEGALLIICGIVLPGVMISTLVFLAHAWPRFVIFKIFMACRRVLPMSLASFLDDARGRNLLRQTAGLYQFSHARLQETLANATRADENVSVRVRTGRRRLGRAAVATVVTIAACSPLVVLPDNTAKKTLPGNDRAFYLRAVTTSPGARHIAAFTDSQTVMVWSLPTGRRVAVLDAHLDTPDTIEFSPDGRLIAVNDIDYGGAAGTRPSSNTTVWNVTSQQELVDKASEIRFLADGKAMIVARQRPGLDRQDLELWDTITGTVRKKLSNAQSLEQLKMIETPSTDRFLAPSSTGAPTLFKASTGDEVQLQPLVDYTATKFDDDGRVILASTPSGLLTWSADDGHFIGTLAAESFSQVKVAPLASARMAVVYGRTQESDADDDTAGIWNTSTGDLITSYHEPTGFGTPALSADGQVAAFSMPGRDATRLVSLADGEEIGTLPSDTTFVGDEYGLDGASGNIEALLLERVRQPSNATTSAATEYRLWDAHGRQIASLHATNSRKSEALGADHLKKDLGDVYTDIDSMNEERINVLFASNGATVAAVASQNAGTESILTFYDVRSGFPIKTVPTEKNYEYLEASASGFSQDGTVFAAVYRTHVVLWDVQDDIVLADITLGSNPNSSPRLAIDPLNRTIVTTHSDSEAAQVWDLRNGNLLGELTGHSGQIQNMLYSADGRTIYSYGSDETVRIWDVPLPTR